MALTPLGVTVTLRPKRTQKGEGCATLLDSEHPRLLTCVPFGCRVLKKRFRKCCMEMKMQIVVALNQINLVFCGELFAPQFISGQGWASRTPAAVFM